MAAQALETTAIFYDIENLLKGYGFSQEELTNLSLRDILQTIQQMGKASRIAMQKAYANWSDSRLKALRTEINTLGIEPIQVFGFSYELKKNAADIQLVIDATELTYTRPEIQTYVIISGDGGFSALTNKLHEYGKTVIGCAYQNSTSKTFQAVCDDFIWIPDPNEDERPSDSSIILKDATGKPFNSLDPRNAQLITYIQPTLSDSPAEILEKTREILEWYLKNCYSDLVQSGIFLSVVQQAIGHLIPEFRPIYWGFAKFIEYMQCACQESALCTARVPPSVVILALRAHIPGDAEILPDLMARPIHSVETYRSLLAVGRPFYHLPPPGTLSEIVDYLVRQPLQRTDFSAAADQIAIALYPVSPETVEATLRTLVSAGVLVRELVDVKLAEQKLSLAEHRSAAEIIDVLKRAMTQKLLATDLPEVDEQVLGQLLV
ncbi:MAG: NYN domain-containing protein [Oscillatoriales cyanobacterium RM1_1_9]|nr:NYN domain-containing protein [Oscillatoriales cyanobacterium RM1_1_9]